LLADPSLFVPLPDLEVQRDTGVEVTTKGVIRRRVGVTVTRTGRAGAGAEGTATRGHHRRHPVHDVVHTKAEVVVIADIGRSREVEVVLSLNLAGEVIEITGKRCARVAKVDRDLANVTPLTRQSDPRRHVEAQTSLVAPFRQRPSAGCNVVTRANRPRRQGVSHLQTS